MAVGIYQTYKVYGTTSGHIVLGASFVLSVTSLVLSLRSKTWKKMMLSSAVKSKVNVIDENKLKVGDIGKTSSRLAPAGKAIINDEFFEVHSHGEFIDPNTEIEVIQIDFNKIYVKQKNK